MKNMYLILAMLLLFTGCEKEEAKEEEQQDPSIIALQKIYDNSNGKGDAITITMEDLEATKVTDLIATKLPQYQTSIGAKMDFSEPAKVKEVKALVTNVNENCGCDSVAKGTISESEKESGTFYYSPADTIPDNYNNYYGTHYGIVVTYPSGWRRTFVVCNDELIPEELKTALSNNEPIEVSFSGIFKNVCVSPIVPSIYTYSRISLTSIEIK